MTMSTIPSWMKYILVPIVPSLMMISPVDRKKRYGKSRSLKSLFNQFTRLEDLVNQFRNHIWHESRICVGKERHRRHQRAAVEIDYILEKFHYLFSHQLKRVKESQVLMSILFLYFVISVCSIQFKSTKTVDVKKLEEATARWRRDRQCSNRFELCDVITLRFRWWSYV